MGNLGGAEMMVVGTIIMLLYFLPTVLGYQKRNWGSIFLLNLLLGWTLIGYVVALVWAVSKDSKQVIVNNNTTPSTAADELLKLADLKQKGIISEEEFEKQKAKVLV